MQKKLKSLLMAASLVAAVAIVLIACGDGEPLDIDSKVKEIDGAGTQLGAEIAEGTVKEGIPPPSSSESPESSSSEELGGTSSQGGGGTSSQGGGGTSSQGGGGTSSQGGGGTSSGGVSSSVQSSSSSGPKSSAQAASGCKESNPKAGFTCGWNVTGTLTPGVLIKPTFSGQGDCSIAWKYVDEFDSTLPDAVINRMCTATTENGFESEGSKNYVLFAELTCADGTHTTACNPKDGLSSKRAPYLTGDCTWGKYDKQPTTSARGAEPTGVTLVDEDKLCGGTKPPIVYKYADGSKNWPAGSVDPGTYTDVQATVPGCTAYNVVPSASCPRLEVNAGADHIIECTSEWQAANCGGIGKNSVTLLADECVEMNVLKVSEQSKVGVSLVMRCQAGGPENVENVSVTLALNGTSKTYNGSWSWNGVIDIGKTKLGDNEFGMLCLTAISGKSNVKCDFGQ
jgi:hypothetical protein